jgi:putative transposase
MCAEMESEIFELEIMPDHCHILLEVDPQFGIAKVIKNLKGRSSRILREEYPVLKNSMPSLWTNSYFVSTVSEVAFDIIQNYIKNQKN